jgi:tetratricopeptide (TPR) repeat protein
MGMGQLDEAIDETNLALQANPNDVETLAFRSLMYRRQGDIDAAERDSGRALEIDPENIQAIGEVAIVALINQDYDRVIDLSTSIIDSNEDALDQMRADAYSWRAQAYLMLGDTSQAASDINMAIRIWPDNSSVYRVIRSDMHMAGDSPSDALDDIEMALTRDQTNPDLLFRKGRTLGALGQYEDAVRFISDAIAARPQFEEAILTRAAAYINLGQNENASRDIDAVLEFNPRSDMALRMRRQLSIE